MDRLKAKKIVRKLPDNAGVYLFWQKATPIYIGKAKSLKNRVASYFTNHLAAKTASMVDESDKLTFLKVNSELEALLLEATLIRKHQPKYNSACKDDKHPLYIRITKEEYPKVLTARKKDLKEKNLAVFGPFPNSSNVHSVLKMLRSIFPYSDHKLGKRPCFYHQIGLCNPCPSEIEQIKNEKLKSKIRQKYLRNIRIIRRILSGNIERVFNELRKGMEEASKREDFEEAAEIREKIRRLEYITQPIVPAEYFLENPNLAEDLRARELSELSTLLSTIFHRHFSLARIECYDVAHLHGSSPTASMVTFIDGEAEKAFYRHFRLRQKESQNDLASMMEVGKRRTGHFKDWGRPNLIIVDGGITQVKVFNQIFSKYQIPIVGIAKRYETLVFPDGKETRLQRGPARNLVERIRDEAHRFARRYHQKLLQKNLIYWNK